MLTDMRRLKLISLVTAAKSEAELLERMKEVAREIGYEHVAFGIELRLPGAMPVQHIMSGYPTEYQMLYRDRAFLARDPTVAHCQTNRNPLVWQEQIYDQRSFEIMEEARRHGLEHGVSLPVHESTSVVSMLSLGRDRPFDSPEESELVISAGTVLAHCLHVTSELLLLPEVLCARRPHLSPREVQCLQLVAIGKSNWDISQLLHISEAAAAFHVKNVLRKFKVSTRTQAVALGVKLGMIT